MSEVSDITPYLPWWLECNKERFPYWFGEREPRLRQLYQALQRPQLFSTDNFLSLAL